MGKKSEEKLRGEIMDLQIEFDKKRMEIIHLKNENAGLFNALAACRDRLRDLEPRGLRI